MTSWFGSGNDTAGRLKAFIKDHLGVSESASFDSQASVDDNHPFNVDSNSRHGMVDRQDTVIHVDVRPKVPPPRPTPPPPQATAQLPEHPSITLPTRDSRIYDFRETDMQFSVNLSRSPDYTQANHKSYQDFTRDPQDPPLSPPLKAISRRLEKQTTWDRGKDYLASMSDSDSDQSLSSHDIGSGRGGQYSSAGSRAYFKTFNSEKFNEQQQKTVSVVSVAAKKTGQITVGRNDRYDRHDRHDRHNRHDEYNRRDRHDNYNRQDRPDDYNRHDRLEDYNKQDRRREDYNQGPQQEQQPYRNSSQARPLVIPASTDPDDGYGSVENSSSGTASSDSSSPSNTPEQVSPGGDAVAVAKRREAFRRSTKKKTTVQEKLRKLCSGESGDSQLKESDKEPTLSSSSSATLTIPSPSSTLSSAQPDIDRCPKCGKQKGVPHLLHMYDSQSICLCDNYSYEESRSAGQSSDALSSNPHPSLPSSSQTSSQNYQNDTNNISVKAMLPALPNRTKIQGTSQDQVSTAKVNFKFVSSNTNTSGPCAPLKADHGITIPSVYDSQSPAEMQGLDARHRDWLVEQNNQISYNNTQPGALPNRADYQTPYLPIDQPYIQPNQQYHDHQNQSYYDQLYDGQNRSQQNGVYDQQQQNEMDCDPPNDQFSSESSRKLLSSQRSKYTNDYAKFMQLLEKTKNKVTAEENQPLPIQRTGSPGQWSGSSSSQLCGSPSVQFMKSSEIYQRLKELKVGGKSSLRRSVSAPQSPVKKKHQLRGAWSEDYAILVRAPLPSAPPRSPAPRDFYQELMSRPTLQLATDF